MESMVLNDKLVLGLAGLSILVRFRYSQFREFCSKYIMPDCDIVDFEVFVTDEQIAEEMACGSQTECEAEILCIYRAIAEKLPLYNRFVMHGAAISFEDKAYIFTAASGTGKSTHIRLWRKAFGNPVGIINGDKPVIEIKDDGTSLVYGTPWAGKERWARNVCFPLGGVCVLHRAEKNSIKKLSASEALLPIMHQIYLPKAEHSAQLQLELADKFLQSAPFWSLFCNIGFEAVRVSFEAMTGNCFNSYFIENEVK